ncbi:MaoC family dehydratase [Streptomyces sp. NPDC018057]|uniref:MaoC family dehydratase n=1 Tax=unclassified Streptomyces TaxID=2593676 RepID=UPI00379132AE
MARTAPDERPAPEERPAVLLTRAPALGPLLARGALRSPFRRPRPDAPVPHTRLVLPSARVDLARLAAYERVCGFPTGADALPLTYPHVLGFPLAMRLMSGGGFPLPLLGLVHTSITLTRHTALRATEAYELSVHIAGLTPHRRGTEAVVVTGLRAAGETVWESTSTYLARHRTAGTTGEAGRSAAEAGPPPAVAEWRLPADLGRRYGAASGDRNPIHLHPLTARLFGFPRPIAHGMWTVARCLAAHGVPGAVSVRAAFKAPVLLPGTVVYAADDRGRFALRAADDGVADGAAGRVHLEGEVMAPGG